MNKVLVAISALIILTGCQDESNQDRDNAQACVDNGGDWTFVGMEREYDWYNDRWERVPNYDCIYPRN